MAQVYLRTKKEEGNAKLYTLVRRNGLQFQLCTGIVVNIKEWKKSEKSQSAKTKYYSTPEGKRVNGDIVKISQTIDQLFKDGLINSNDDKHLIEEAISDIALVESRNMKEQAKLIKKEQEGNLIAFCDEVIEGIKNGSIRSQGKRYSQATIGNMNAFGQALKGFLKGREETTFADIDKKFSDGFISYVEKCGLMRSTINLYITEFRHLCGVAAERGVNKNATSLKVWHKPTVQKEDTTTKIYLTDEEIDALYNLKLDGLQDQTRDLFLVACLTCQRYSDFSTLTRDNFKKTENGTTILSLTQKKTGTYVEIPIYDNRLLDIFKKYDYKLPTFHIHRFNINLKNVMRLLAQQVPSMDEKYPTKITKLTQTLEKNFMEMDAFVKAGGKLQKDSQRDFYSRYRKYAEENNGQPLFERNEKGEIMRHKWELVSSHTGRRSGITNLYKTGILDSREIMSISGHKSEQVYKGYIKISVSEQADRIFEKLRTARG